MRACVRVRVRVNVNVCVNVCECGLTINDCSNSGFRIDIAVSPSVAHTCAPEIVLS